MAYTVHYLDAVIADVHQAKTWYKAQRVGLEEDFAAAIEQAIERIAQMPTAYGIRYKNIRFAHPKVFPYNIHFYLDEARQMIVITAIVHSRRHPDVSQGRV
ncbi:MAG: type II toxin-antitoxin system RelE/ParE family toxin [Bacteroidetes bacterium]|nr:type II toxin-antitoxin system RelE/ParE family toxin [Bacteroidota bacterium]